MTSGDHGLLHMVHDGFPVSVLGQCQLFWFQNQKQTVRSHPIAVLPLQSPKSHVCAGSTLTNRTEPIRIFPPRNTARYECVISALNGGIVRVRKVMNIRTP